LHPSQGLLPTVMYIRVSMSATDNHGIPVNAGIVYYDPDSFFAQRPAFSGAFAKRGSSSLGSCEVLSFAIRCGCSGTRTWT
jgi:hypothetical protein